MPAILISGANGFIARNFRHKFKDKYNFICISHKACQGNLTYAQLENKPELIKQADIVLNLAGANIGAGRWNDVRKNELLNSRLNTTQKLVDLFNQYNPAAHFISASAAGIYEPTINSDENIEIDYNSYSNFSQEITRKWEQTALQYQGNLTITRFGVVLSGNGGAFPQMLRPFLFYTGGHLGNGKQYFPWIALPDLLNALDQIINRKLTGIYNLVAPTMVTNSALSLQISRIWNKPNWLHLPESLIRIIFGQMGQELFLNSIQVYPSKLTGQGFNYGYSKIENCLMAIRNKLF